MAARLADGFLNGMVTLDEGQEESDGEEEGEMGEVEEEDTATLDDRSETEHELMDGADKD